MLLDLYAAKLENSEVSVSSLCIAAAVAPTTALRWIGRLTDAGFLERRADPFDRRRAYLELSEQAAEGMRRYVAAVRAAALPFA
jgi:DNA-binding MarR family transcriptional regulator